MIVTALESSPNVPVMETVIKRLLHEEKETVVIPVKFLQLIEQNEYLSVTIVASLDI